jgi:hypothetical protein
MRSRKRPPKPVRIGGVQDQMDVIGHEDPRPDFDAGRAAMLVQKLLVEGVILVQEECPSVAVAALRHMMRNFGNADAR